MTEQNTTETKPIYDPKKHYKWNADDTFTFSGIEFDIMYKAATAFMGGNLSETKVILGLADIFAILQNGVVKGVESGMLTEHIEEPLTNNKVMEFIPETNTEGGI